LQQAAAEERVALQASIREAMEQRAEAEHALRLAHQVTIRTELPANGSSGYHSCSSGLRPSMPSVLRFRVC